MRSILPFALAALASLLACAPRQAPYTIPTAGIQTRPETGFFDKLQLKALLSNLGVGRAAAGNGSDAAQYQSDMLFR